MKKKIYILLFCLLIINIFHFPVFSDSFNSEDEILFAKLTSNDKNEIHLALAEIKTRKPNSLVSLIVNLALDNQDSIQSESAIKALKLYSKLDILDSWLHILRYSENYNRKLEVLNYISDLNNRKMVVPLAQMLVSPIKDIRETSARILSKIGDDRMYPVILKISDSLNPRERIYFVDAMKYLYDQRFHNILMKMLKDENKSVRIYVVNTIATNFIYNALTNIRFVALNDENDEVKITAIKALERFNDKKSLYVFLRSLSSENSEIRYSAVHAIKKNKLFNAVNTLSSRLINEDKNSVKNIILDTLIEMKKLGNISGVKKILFSDDAVELKIKAAVLFGIIKNKGIEEFLIRALKDKNFRVRAEVSNSLGFYKSSISLKALFDILKNENKRYVKSSALYAIKRINRKDSIEPLFLIFSYEKDPVFKSIMRETILKMIKKNI